MIIALPADQKRQDAMVNGQFGRARYFCIYDTDDQSYQFIDNPAISAPGGAGVRSASELANLGVRSVVAYHVGDNALRVLQRNGISIYRPQSATIEANASAFAKGQLVKLV